MKLCRQCLEEKSPELFYKNKANRDGLSSYCKDCQKIRNDDYYLLNTPKFRTYSKEWREGNREKIRQSAKVYDRKVQTKRNAIEAKRRATKLLATPKWVDNEELFLIEEAYHLANIRSKLLNSKWHVDHIVPLKSKVVCGLHCINNLRVIPQALNSAKGNRYWPNMP